jgi:curved DNA-binding protein CbpA
MPHYYGVLGIATDADRAQVKTAFRTLAKTCHPDLEGGHAEHFREIIVA